MTRLSFALPAVLLLTIGQACSRGDDGQLASAARFDERAFGQLPIRFNGRVTDFDRYARNVMLRISGRETWQGKDGKPLPATAWLLELMSGSDIAESVPVLLVEDPQVRELLKLDPGAAERRISIQDLPTRLLPFMERVDDISRFVNNWRKLEGRAPLALEKVRTAPVQIAGQTGWRIDIESPDGLPVKSERMLAVGFSQGAHGYVVVCSGSKSLMTKHAKDFDQFVASIRIESPTAIEKWISLPKPESPPQSHAGTKAALAIVPDKQDLWLIQGEYSDQENSEEKIATLKMILQSIQFRPRGKGTEPSDLLPFEWTLPEGWQLEEFPDGQLWVVSRTPPAFVALTLQPLKTEEGWSRPALINQWRSKFELPDLTPEQINDITQTLTLDNRKIQLVVVDIP